MLDKTVSKRGWLSRILLPVATTRDLRGPRVLAGIHTQERFEEFLLKERARAERTNSPFALVLLDVALDREQPEYGQAMQVLSEILHARVRRADTAGWFEHRLAVILTDIQPECIDGICDYIEGEFQSQVRDRLDRQCPSPALVCEVYLHPMAIASGGIFSPVLRPSGED
jgi:hypothetical protein